MTASALYTGVVRHRRLADHAGAFRHPITLAYLDLDELPRLLGGRLVRRAPGVVRVRRRDLIGGADGPPVAEAVRDLVEQRTGRSAPAGPVRVLTTPRTYGTCFNPVSFYYVFDGQERLDSVVAEVTSTPWLQRHAYVLRRGADDRGVLTGAHDKALHVSPFQHMEHRHVWAVTAPGPTLSVHIANHRTADGAADFDATLSLRRTRLTAAALRGAYARPPAAALRTLALIYGHAAVLKLCGAAHFPPPLPTPGHA
ncbi:MAG TPA: DUF1365 domain-containing protein [Baekduia sp.]|nr:DUF1365 domain-containing protein [Baekduia sp.]